MVTRYYDEKLGIDGTAEDLARFGTQYADDYADEGLEKIVEILKTEHMQEQASRVAYELESRRELREGLRDVARLKLWAMDGMYQLIDEEDNDAFYLSMIHENDQVIISVTGKAEGDDEVRSNTDAMPVSEFMKLTAKEFENRVNAVWFYAQ